MDSVQRFVTKVKLKVNIFLGYNDWTYLMITIKISFYPLFKQNSTQFSGLKNLYLDWAKLQNDLQNFSFSQNQTQ